MLNPQLSAHFVADCQRQAGDPGKSASVASGVRGRAPKIPLATLQGWEQHRRHPDKTATAYLTIIARLTAETRAALQT